MAETLEGFGVRLKSDPVRRLVVGVRLLGRVAWRRRRSLDRLARAVRVLGRRVGDDVDLVEQRAVVARAAGDGVDLAVAGVDPVVAGPAVERVADGVDLAVRPRVDVA